LIGFLLATSYKLIFSKSSNRRMICYAMNAAKEHERTKKNWISTKDELIIGQDGCIIISVLRKDKTVLW